MNLAKTAAIVIASPAYLLAGWLMIHLSNKRIERRNQARQRLRDVITTRLFMEGKR